MYCYDDPTSKQHDRLVQRALELPGLEQEGQDLRNVDLGFFAGLYDEEMV
jgi:hypothetical protein